MAVMDWKVMQAIVENNVAAFKNLVEQDDQVLDRRIGNTTVLHLASRIGNHQMVSRILELRPQMVDNNDNSESETPIHEACRMGHLSVVKLLIDNNQWVASKLNCHNQTALFLACSYGHVTIVDFLVDQTGWLFTILDGSPCLHVAASKGPTDIAKRLLEKCPDLAQRKDINGSLALHCACRTGQLEIATMLLRLDPDQALQFDNNGYTPLHLAAINGNLPILEEFASTSPLSFHVVSKHGGNLFHLTLRFNKFEAFKFVDGVLKGTDLFYQTDKIGNTIQHLAQIGGHQKFANYIIRETKEQINHQNDVHHRYILDQTELPTTAKNGNEIYAETVTPSLVEPEKNRNTRDRSSKVSPKKRASRATQGGTTECKKHSYTSCYLDSNSHIHSWYEPSWWCLSGRTSKRQIDNGKDSSFQNLCSQQSHCTVCITVCSGGASQHHPIQTEAINGDTSNNS